MAFHRTDWAPWHGVSSNGPDAGYWRFSSPRGWLSRASPSPSVRFWIAARGFPRRLPPRPRRRLDRQRRCFVWRARLHGAPAPCLASEAPGSRGHGGDVRGEGASRANGVHLPRRRRRAAPACEWRQRVTPHAHHSRRHEAVAAAAAPLFCVLRSAPDAVQSRERPRP